MRLKSDFLSFLFQFEKFFFKKFDFSAIHSFYFDFFRQFLYISKKFVFVCANFVTQI